MIHVTNKESRGYQVGVSKRLAAAGFSRSIATARDITEGFTTQPGGGPSVLVRWVESLDGTAHRDLAGIPDSSLIPHRLRYAHAYAGVLEPRYTVQIDESTGLLRVESRGKVRAVPVSKVRPLREKLASHNIPLASDGLFQDRGGLAGCCILREVDHARLHVRAWDHMLHEPAKKAVINALRPWVYEMSDDIESTIFKIKYVDMTRGE